MQNYTATSSNLVMFVPRLGTAAYDDSTLVRFRSRRVIELDAAARAKANAKKRVVPISTLNPNDLTAA